MTMTYSLGMCHLLASSAHHFISHTCDRIKRGCRGTGRWEPPAGNLFHDARAVQTNQVLSCFTLISNSVGARQRWSQERLFLEYSIISICGYTHIYIYIYREREREREIDRHTYVCVYIYIYIYISVMKLMVCVNQQYINQGNYIIY